MFGKKDNTQKADDTTTKKPQSGVVVARLLVASTIGEHSFSPNALVKGSAEELKPLLDDGSISDDKAGIEYCESEGVEIVDLAELAKTSQETKPE
jgi:hypothetical protein